MGLYHKYRPQKIKDLIGNEDVASYLDNVLTNIKECPHVILLYGLTGCGKTTTARIIANKLGCVGSDLREINCADFNGVDTAREITRKAKYKPAEGKVRVCIIDEAHRLTTPAQDALLKILEDCPKSLYFIICTTEPKKLIPTFQGRCTKLQMSTLNDDQMLSLLQKIVKAEGGKLKSEVYDQIIEDSVGLPRNAIQVLEMVIKLPKKKQLEAAKRSAEEVSQSIELCRALISNRGWKAVSTILKGIKDQEPESIRRHVMSYAQSVLLGKEDNTAALILDEFWEPLYNTGFPGLVLVCYKIVKG